MGITVAHIPHTIATQPCIDFVNSRWTDHRGSATVRDDLGDAGWRHWFLVRWGYPLGAGLEAEGLDEVRRAREGLRSVLEAWSLGLPLPEDRLRELSGLVARNAGRLALDTSEALPRLGFEPERRDWRWVVAEMVRSAAELMASGEPRRLKACANPSCTWLFYDESHNRSRRWCDAAACGNLLKVRAHRARLAEASA